MANEYSRMNNARFNNYSQHANSQRPGQYYNEASFQQQPQATPSGYYPAFQTSRPLEPAATFGLASYGFQGWNQGNGNYKQNQESSTDTSPWRQMTGEASSGLSSLAFASGLAQASNSFDQLRAQSNLHNQHAGSSIGNNRAAQVQANRSNNMSQPARLPQVSPSIVSGAQSQRKHVHNQSSQHGSGVQMSNSTLSMDNRPSVTYKNGSNTASFSNSMFVNPSQVYNPPASYRPASQQSMEQDNGESEGQQTNAEEANTLQLNDTDSPQALPQENKKRGRRATGETDGNKKVRARKTGSSTAPSQKRRKKDTNVANANPDSTQEANTLESQMRSMFLKMREFNEMNPELLAKLWQEERENHISKTAAAENASGHADVQPEAQAAESTALSSAKKSTPKAMKRNSKTNETATEVKSPPSTAKVASTAKSRSVQPMSIRDANDVSPNGNSQLLQGSTRKEVSSEKQKTVAPRVQTPVAIATKEDRAYKKTFADLVDLTADSSDEGPMFSVRPQEAASEVATVPSHGDTAPDVPPNGQFHQPPQSHASNPIPSNQQALAPRLRPRPPPEMILAQPVDKYKAIRRSGYNPKTIARDVLIACGRHPDMRRLNEHLTLLKDGFPGQMDLSSDLSTVRWDLIDPGGPPPGSASTQPIIVDADDADDESVDEPPLYETPRLARQAQPRTLQWVQSEAQPRPASRSSPASNSHTKPSYSTRFVGMDPSERLTLGKRGRPRGRPRASTSSKGGSPAVAIDRHSGYTALRAQQAQHVTGTENSETPKKRGRPVGWRKWMMKGADPSSRPGAGRPAPEPYYHIYKCHWAGCAAELHNLDTLRKHLHKKHEQTPPTIECLWSDCGIAQPVSDPATGRVTTKWERQKFDTNASWGFHIEKQHLSPIAWKFGDGPTGGILDPEGSDASEAYNSDAQGRSVTPQINVPSEHAEKALQYEMDILAGGRIPKKTQEEKARDVQSAVESEKRAIGPGIDRGGAIFANEKRRMGFIDEDEDIVLDEDK